MTKAIPCNKNSSPKVDRMALTSSTPIFGDRRTRGRKTDWNSRKLKAKASGAPSNKLVKGERSSREKAKNVPNAANIINSP